MPLTAPAMVGIGAGLGLNAIKNNKATKVNKQAVDLARDNAEFIKSYFPNSMSTIFPGGSFNMSLNPAFQQTPYTPGTPGYYDDSAGQGGFAPYVAGTPASGGNLPSGTDYIFSLDGGVEVPSQSGLSDLIDQFADLREQYNAADVDISKLHQISGQVDKLLPDVAVGSSLMRQARLRQLTEGEQAADSNLKGAMERRRILGSSFANDALQRNALDFANARADAEAVSYLEEVDATAQLLDFQAGVASKASEILMAKLSGQHATLVEERNTEQMMIRNIMDAQMANMEFALQGQANAMQFLSSMANAVNASTGHVTGALGSQADSIAREGELFGDVAAGVITGQLGTPGET